MEKENRKAQEDARREYNDTVRVGPPLVTAPSPSYVRIVSRNVRSKARSTI